MTASQIGHYWTGTRLQWMLKGLKEKTTENLSNEEKTLNQNYLYHFAIFLQLNVC